ncbi:MAG TPA: hypothetical protein VMV18_13895 [bacterium]|nr:hypothetical protein [bacterium]
MTFRLAAALAAAAATFALGGRARAAVDTHPVECPVDSTEVSVTIPLSTNALLGHDRDLCPHASDPASDEIATAVSGCTTCGFAGTPAEFQGELSETVVARIKQELKPAGTPWERYANRARILEWTSAPEASIGESWLRAAWSVRLEARDPGDPELAEAMKKVSALAPDTSAAGKPAGAQSGAQRIAADALLDPAHSLEALLEGEHAPESRADRAAGWYAAASLWRSRGELANAEARFGRALDAATGTPLAGAVKNAVERDRSSMSLEKDYLARALTHFKTALALQKLPAHQKALLAFLAAECARRTGAAGDAAALYREASAVKDPDADPQMKPLLDAGLAETSAAKPAGRTGKTGKTEKTDKSGTPAPTGTSGKKAP